MRQQEKAAQTTRGETKARKHEQKRMRLVNEAEEAERKKADDLKKQIEDDAVKAQAALIAVKLEHMQVNLDEVC